MKTKPCPDCKRVAIPEDQGQCWGCWHEFLVSLNPPKICTAPDCPQHGPLQRVGLVERIVRWWKWRELRRHSAKMAKLEVERGGPVL